MTVDSKPAAVRPDAGRADPDARDSTGLLLARLTVLPALVMVTFLLTSFPLLLLGVFRPAPALLLWAALTAALVPYAWRRIPSVTGAGSWLTPDAGRAEPTPRWVLWSMIAIAVVFTAWQAAYHSQFIIVMLDAASYTQFANWIAAHGSLPIPASAAAFGHATGITFASAAFYQVGGSIMPQFMAGLPMVLSLGFWAGGVRVALLLAPLLGGLGVFTFGGLVARLVGPRWAPLGAAAIAVGIPEQYVSRMTYSETLAQVVLLGGLALWIDAQRADRGAADAGPWRAHWRSHARSASHVLAGLAGLLLGITLLVRVDGPADILFVVPYCGLLVLRRQRQVIALVAGMAVGLVYGAVDALLLARPYLDTNKQSVEAMTLAFVGGAAATAVVVWWLRRRGSQLRPPYPPRLLLAVTLLPFLLIAVFIVRPYVERNWHALQYAPISLHWIYWYVGAPVIVFTVIGFAMLGRRCAKGEAPAWALPLITFGWAIVWFLLRPAITPHQPYASRRLVPAVLPGLLLVSVWLAAWLARKARTVRLVDVPPALRRTPRAFTVACCAGAIIAPIALDNLGGLAFTRSYVGEVAAVAKICAGLPANSSVLIADYTMNQQFAQAIRGECGVPVAGLGTTQWPGTQVVPANAGSDVTAGISVPAVQAAVAAVEQTGRQPVVLASTTKVAARLGPGTVRFLMAEDTTIGENLVFGTPRGTIPQRFTVYSWEPAK